MTTASTPIDISLVIPAYNEAAYLPRLLDTVDAARARYRHGAERIEVIVADNCSTDDTAKIAQARGCIVQNVPKRLIAAARNGGAVAARGEVVAFADADFRIFPETFNYIDAMMQHPDIIGGATGLTMERWSSTPRASTTNTATGTRSETSCWGWCTRCSPLARSTSMPAATGTRIDREKLFCDSWRTRGVSPAGRETRGLTPPARRL